MTAEQIAGISVLITKRFFEDQVRLEWTIVGGAVKDARCVVTREGLDGHLFNLSRRWTPDVMTQADVFERECALIEQFFARGLPDE